MRVGPWLSSAVVLAALTVGGAKEGQSLTCVSLLEHVRGIRGITTVAYSFKPRAEVMPGVAVKVRRGDFEASTISDEDGYFTFQDLPQGDYELTAELEGHNTAHDTVEVRDGASRALVLVIELTTGLDNCSGVRTETWKRARRLQEQGRQRRD